MMTGSPLHWLGIFGGALSREITAFFIVTGLVAFASGFVNWIPRSSPHIKLRTAWNVVAFIQVLLTTAILGKATTFVCVHKLICQELDFLWFLLLQIGLTLFAHLGYLSFSIYHNITHCRPLVLNQGRSSDDQFLLDSQETASEVEDDDEVLDDERF